jgi:hypothetical protein
MRTLIVVLSVALLALGSLGCQKKEGPAEKAGKQIDQAVEKTGSAAKEMTDKAGKKLDEAADKFKSTADKAQEK